MTMLMDLRKLSNHPLLMRYYYDENKLRKLSKYLSKDTFYKENNAQYIYEDLLFMSDFQIHQLTQQYKVNYPKYSLYKISLTSKTYFI